jgi:hypothetical protein
MAKAYHCSRSPRLNCVRFRPSVFHSRSLLPISAAPRLTFARVATGLPLAFWRCSPCPGWLRSALAGYNRILSCGRRAALDFDLWSRCK